MGAQVEGLPLLNFLRCRGIAKEQKIVGMILVLVHDEAAASCRNNTLSGQNSQIPTLAVQDTVQQ